MSEVTEKTLFPNTWYDIYEEFAPYTQVPEGLESITSDNPNIQSYLNRIVASFSS